MLRLPRLLSWFDPTAATENARRALERPVLVEARIEAIARRHAPARDTEVASGRVAAVGRVA
ncbi:MAG TPA: hypothetical protein VFZ83_02310 [Acidimicrobiia bacterium]|nr:hypothetical protein [Acidimicrobiia bacterium]